MAGGHSTHRHLSRPTAHRRALLRNLVTSLFTHEAITTTWPKAKEAQRLADKLVTLGKRGTEAAKRRAGSVFFTPHHLLPKLFGPLATRYASRPGGYTRVLRIEPAAEDQAPSALLELVDGPRDVRFAMTARTLARLRAQEDSAAGDGGKKGEDEGRGGEGRGEGRWNEITTRNVRKVTRYREGGEEELMREVERVGREQPEGGERGDRERGVAKRQVYRAR